MTRGKYYIIPRSMDDLVNINDVNVENQQRFILILLITNYYPRTPNLQKLNFIMFLEI